ncbi:MAG: helix-turn-helix domain-containing protein [Actinomycetota bacterium]|nr:helix-turn-helix domain-containing protein [Actinomycetota bacterium]
MDTTKKTEATKSTPISRAPFLTVNEVSEILRVSNMTVYRLIKTGDLPAVRVGRSFRVREDDIDKYLSDRYTKAG